MKNREPFVCSTMIAVFLVVSVSATAIHAESATPAGEESVKETDSGKAALPAELKHPNHRRFNVRLAGGANFALGDDLEEKGLGEIGGIGAIGIDWVLFEPLAFSILAGYSAFSEGDDGALQDLFATVGFRLRLFADKSGSVVEEGGNLAGHLFLDAHFGYHSYEKEEHAGYNVGLGYELAISRDFNLGPFVRFTHAPIGDGFSYMSVSFGVQLSVGGKFKPDDADKDGIEDSDDKCPLVAEDKDGFEDDDGCEETDNDKDGVPDVDDECPETAGVASNRGCEENDDDHDGVLNDDDSCPDEAEDKDDYGDDDGCPDPDNDGDRIDDASDKCPNDAEDKDGFEDDDGCPDNDNDADKVLDEHDKCPFLPETVNKVKDEDGCPDFVSLRGNRILLLDSVYFAKNKAEIDERSHPMLDELAALLKLKHELSIRVEGHTDNRGGQKKNQKISKDRADSIKTYLETKGVAGDRIESIGMGQASPLEDNRTKQGREKNNRIEIHVVQEKQVEASFDKNASPPAGAKAKSSEGKAKEAAPEPSKKSASSSDKPKSSEK